MPVKIVVDLKTILNSYPEFARFYNERAGLEIPQFVLERMKTIREFIAHPKYKQFKRNHPEKLATLTKEYQLDSRIFTYSDPFSDAIAQLHKLSSDCEIHYSASVGLDTSAGMRKMIQLMVKNWLVKHQFPHLNNIHFPQSLLEKMETAVSGDYTRCVLIDDAHDLYTTHINFFFGYGRLDDPRNHGVYDAFEQKGLIAAYGIVSTPGRFYNQIPILALPEWSNVDNIIATIEMLKEQEMERVR